MSGSSSTRKMFCFTRIFYRQSSRFQFPVASCQFPVPGLPRVQRITRSRGGGIGIRAVKNQVSEPALEIGEYARAVGSYRDNVTVTNAAIAFDVHSGFDVEHHAGFEHFGGLGVNARPGVVGDGRETHAVAGGMAELFAEAALGQKLTGGMVNLGSLDSGSNRRQRRLSRLEHGSVNALLFFIYAP